MTQFVAPDLENLENKTNTKADGNFKRIDTLKEQLRGLDCDHKIVLNKGIDYSKKRIKALRTSAAIIERQKLDSAFSLGFGNMFKRHKTGPVQ